MTQNVPTDHYDRIAGAWELVLGDDWHHGVFERPEDSLEDATERLTAMMAQLGRIETGTRVLDAGCGSGHQACVLAERYGAASVIGVSTSAVSLERARRRAAADGLAERVEFRRQDARATDLPDGSVDVVWTLESAQYLTPWPRTMDEFVRVLAPGGRIVLADVVLRRELTLRDLRHWHEEFAVIGRAFGDGELGRIEGYLDGFRTAGLEVEFERELSEQVVPTYARWRERAAAERDRITELIGHSAWADFIEACSCLERFFTEGVMGYALLAAVLR